MSRRVAIVGAGLAGVAAAGELAHRGFAVTLFDKSPRVGGRMATRRMDVPGLGTATFDHGCQRWQGESGDFARRLGLEPWFAGAFRSPGGMRAAVERLTDVLSPAVELRLNERVDFLTWNPGGWTVATGRQPVRADWLVLTPPLPKALDLIGDQSEAIPPALRDVRYTRCITILAAGHGATRLPSDGGIWFDSEPLRAVVDNHAKGLSTVGPAVTIHAAAEASETLWDEPTEAVTAELLDWARPWVEFNAPATHVHRWRYNRPLTTWPEPCFVDPGRRLVLVGDAFGGPTLDGVFRSGMAAAEAVT